MVRTGTYRALALWCACVAGLSAGLSQAQAEPGGVSPDRPAATVARSLHTLAALADWSWVESLDEAVDRAAELAQRLCEALREAEANETTDEEGAEQTLAALSALLSDGYRDPTERAEPTFIEDVRLADPYDAWTLEMPQVASWDLDYGLSDPEPIAPPGLSPDEFALLARALATQGALPAPEPTSAALLALSVFAAGGRRRRSG